MSPAAHDWGEPWDDVADVVVVGAGAAGATAALSAAAAGASVLVLEKGESIGGTTGKSDGVLWVCDNPVMRRQGIADPRPEALRYLARSAYPTSYDPEHPSLGLTALHLALIESFYDHGREAIEHLEAAAGLRFEPVPYPDYYATLPEDAAPLGRVIQAAYPAGWNARADPPGGQLLVERVLAAAAGLGTTVRTGQRAAHVVRDEDGSVVGLEVHAGLRTVLVGARRGVVFASGGFLHDPDLVRAHLRGPVLGGAANAGATGDFVRIGIEAGAQLGNMCHAWWDQVVAELALHNRATSHDLYSPYGDSMLMVNRYGVRVVNEKAPYNERGQAHLYWDGSHLEYPNYLLFMIFDDDVMTLPPTARFRWPIPRAGREKPAFIHSAPDLPGLAAVLRNRLASLAGKTGGVQLDPAFEQRLAATIERFNGFARSGRDEDFGRGASPIEQAWAGTGRGDCPSAAMHPLRSEGPYHAMIVGPGALDTKGGPLIDGSGQVLGLDGSPIPGLFGAGNCIASPAGQAYWGPGGTIGPAVAFGYLAGRSAARRPAQAPSGALR